MKEHSVDSREDDEETKESVVLPSLKIPVVNSWLIKGFRGLDGQDDGVRNDKEENGGLGEAEMEIPQLKTLLHGERLTGFSTRHSSLASSCCSYQTRRVYGRAILLLVA